MQSNETIRVVGSNARAMFGGDLRRYRRLQATLPGRFMAADRQESQCTLRDISVGGAAVISSAKPNTGERIIAYFDHLGGIEGHVVRHTADGFAFQFSVSDHKREKLAAQLTWLINHTDYPESAARGSDRVATGSKRTFLRFEDGVTIDVLLIDISPTGAAVSTPARPPIGSAVAIGSLRAIVRRHTDKGLGLQFETPMTLEAVKSHFA